MNSHMLWVLAAFLVLASVPGCQDKSATSRTTDGDASPADLQPQEGSDTPTITVDVASWDEVQAMVADQKGKVVVVDLWSTWCVPCMREFPNLVKLQDRFPDQVACISVNLNYDGSADAPPESHRDNVLKFLTKQKADFRNIICSDSDEKMYDTLDLGSIPAIYVYNEQGELHKRFDNDSGEYGEEGFTYEQHVIPLVEQLIGS